MKRLKVHLTPLREEYEVDVWEDTRIRPGSKWRQEIRAAVARANVAILVVTANYLASDFVRTNELPPLLKAAEEEGALILPIIASPSLFLRNPDLSQFQSVNNPSTPLMSSSESEQEETFLKVAEAILDRAALARRRQDTPAAVTGALRSENFLERATWNRLIRIGDWILDHDAGRIIGSGMHAYLLSREDYGEAPFVIQASLEFTNFMYPSDNEPGMNAGIVLGWSQEKPSSRYYNILLSGSNVLVERIGFRDADAYRDFEHITEAHPLAIKASVPVELTVRVDPSRLDIFAAGTLIHSLERPSGVVGRVGLRPWRSKMDCTKFVVFEEHFSAEHTVDGGRRP